MTNGPTQYTCITYGIEDLLGIKWLMHYMIFVDPHYHWFQSTAISKVKRKAVISWLAGCFGFNGPLRQISVYIGPSPRERKKEMRKDRGE